MKTIVLITGLAMLAMFVAPASAQEIEGDPAACAGFVTDGYWISIGDPTAGEVSASCWDDTNDCEGSLETTEDDAEAGGCGETDTKLFGVSL